MAIRHVANDPRHLDGQDGDFAGLGESRRNLFVWGLSE
jgi:hypothetical protein